MNKRYIKISHCRKCCVWKLKCFCYFNSPSCYGVLRRVSHAPQEGFDMETLVDAGLVPDTSKWKYPISPSVSFASSALVFLNVVTVGNSIIISVKAGLR